MPKHQGRPPRCRQPSWHQQIALPKSQFSLSICPSWFGFCWQPRAAMERHTQRPRECTLVNSHEGHGAEVMAHLINKFGKLQIVCNSDNGLFVIAVADSSRGMKQGKVIDANPSCCQVMPYLVPLSGWPSMRKRTSKDSFFSYF